MDGEGPTPVVEEGNQVGADYCERTATVWNRLAPSAKNAVLGRTTPRHPVLPDKVAVALTEELVQVCVAHSLKLVSPAL